uniref:Uncharacterized protein n=1 Tax=Helianthus annuus TaxID=4232 RepID=A0A251USG1_HELAN
MLQDFTGTCNDQRKESHWKTIVSKWKSICTLISCRLGDGLWVSAKVCLLFISSTISPLTRVCSIVTIVESIELLTVSTTSIARNVVCIGHFFVCVLVQCRIQNWLPGRVTENSQN